MEGDKSAGGARLTDRSPRVMKEFKKSPLLGYGYSDKMNDYYDGHVANQSILLHTGVFGFIILYFIIFRILWKLFSFYLRLKRNNPIRFKILSMIIGLLGILVIHLSSRSMIAYYLDGDNAMLLAFWFLFTLHYLDKAIKYERK
jgi:cytochrome b561